MVLSRIPSCPLPCLLVCVYTPWFFPESRLVLSLSRSPPSLCPPSLGLGLARASGALPPHQSHLHSDTREPHHHDEVQKEATQLASASPFPSFFNAPFKPLKKQLISLTEQCNRLEIKESYEVCCPDLNNVGHHSVCDDATRKRVISRPTSARSGLSLQFSKIAFWSISVLTLAGVFAAGWALGSRKLLSKDAGLPVSLVEAHLHTVAKEAQEQILGHFRAEEAPQSDLKAVLADQSVMLRTAAANAFLKMQGIARQDGVWLLPLSGFRSVQCQRKVFFNVKADRGQQTVERAKVSAPPGYSEHHTGYAIDVGDSSAVGTHLQTEFDQTAAFSWLKANAARFHFEMSFPLNNENGIMYEPWHWRFVGDDDSLRTFFSCKNQGIHNGC